MRDAFEAASPIDGKTQANIPSSVHPIILSDVIRTPVTNDSTRAMRLRRRGYPEAKRMTRDPSRFQLTQV
jgi:hypothetical protein